MRRRSARGRALGLGLAMVFAAAAAAAQEPPEEGAPVALSERLRRGDPEAIALLERRFAEAATEADKKRTAALLAALGRGDVYYQYLAAAAAEAVASEVPFPLQLDDRGEPIPQRLSADFLAWAAAAGVEPDRAAWEAVYELPSNLLYLGMTFDPRAAAILRDGLSSSNSMIVYRAAEGLARVGAVADVPAVIAAAEAAPGRFPQLIARALVAFEDPRAQAAAERLIGDPQVLAALRRQAEDERRQIEQDLTELPR